MKRLFFFSILLMSILIYGIFFGATPEKGKVSTFIGKVDTLRGVRMFEEVPNREDRIIVFDSESKTTPQFVKCLDDAQSNSSVVEITAKVKSLAQPQKESNSTFIYLNFDKTSTCKRR